VRAGYSFDHFFALLFFFLADLCAAEAPSGPYFWESEKLDVSELKRLGAEKTAAEVLTSLRKTFGIKVLVLEAMPNPGNLRKTPGVENLPADLTSAQYYADPKNKQTAMALGKQSFGQFLAPHDYAATIAPKRPFVDQNLILLAPFATRDVLLHEFVHYLLSRERNLPLQKCGTIPCTHHAFVTDQYFKAEKAHEKAYVAYQSSLFEAALYQGEELSVNKIVLSHAKDLALTPDDKFRAKEYLKDRYQKFKKYLEGVVQDPELTGAKNLISKAKIELAKLQKIADWYDNTGRKI
jgi:hypothetical protein